MCCHCDLYFSSLTAKLLHGASCRFTKCRIENTTEPVRPLQVAASRQRELLCVMPFQEMEWAFTDEVDAKDFDLSNITVMKIKLNLVLQSSILMKSFQSGQMKVRSECIDIILLVKYQP